LLNWPGKERGNSGLSKLKTVLFKNGSFAPFLPFMAYAPVKERLETEAVINTFPVLKQQTHTQIKTPV
jgi:hypothetical protein